MQNASTSPAAARPLNDDLGDLPVIPVTAGPEKSLAEHFADDEARLERIADLYFYDRSLEI